MANQLKMAKIQAILSLHAQGWTQSPHRGDLAGRSGNGTKVRSATVVRPKTSKRADRLGGLKTARFAERPGSGIKTSKRADRLTG